MSALPTTLAGWRKAYADGRFSVAEAIAQVRTRLRHDDTAWIHRCDDRIIAAQIEALGRAAPQGPATPGLPLYGVPFAVKDNIDVQGLPTTAACPAFAHEAERTAEAVRRLMAAGAILVGKTNLDQFATGLVGTRSPYGEVPNAFDPQYVSGGSSSGSASVVARGLVAFALGTDTAGSGRVPAGFNNIVGLKPTPGLVSTGGVLPACRSLDCVSVFALTVSDAAQVLAVMEGPVEGEARFHAAPPGPARFSDALRVGVPRSLHWCGDGTYEAAFADALVQCSRMGARLVEVDTDLLHQVAELLYDGPWVAERYAVLEPLLTTQPEAVDPVVRRVVEAALAHGAVDTFRAQYRLRELAVRAQALWQDIDVLLVPTAPTLPTRAAVAAEPVQRNSELGHYTNFVNLLGQAALAVPAGFTPAGLPFGVTFIAPGGCDAALAALGARWQAALGLPLGARLARAELDDLQLVANARSEPTLPIAVVGAHLAGMPLHGQLVERGCRLRRRTRTASRYRLYALAGTVPPKPGLARADDGAAIEVEVYDMPLQAVGSFLSLIPSPLGLGSVELEDGQWVQGFICEPWALAGAEDITRHGGWRAYLAARQALAPA